MKDSSPPVGLLGLTSHITDIYVLSHFFKLLIDYFPSDNSIMENVSFYFYKDLRTATKDFNPVNKIGEGGFGSVYKVIWILNFMYF